MCIAPFLRLPAVKMLGKMPQRLRMLVVVVMERRLELMSRERDALSPFTSC